MAKKEKITKELTEEEITKQEMAKQLRNLHKGHRQKVRQRFINERSLDHFEEHQVLELILFFAMPYVDTNDAAHLIINEFGSLYAVLDADPVEIVNRCQDIRCGSYTITEATAVLISMYPHVFRRYLQSKLDNVKLVIDSSKAAAEYLRAFLIGKTTECFYLLCLDSGRRLRKTVKISEGTVNKTQIFLRNIIKEALNHNASYLVIAHNHPGGACKPSKADVNSTEKIIQALVYVDIELLDHIIICDDYVSKYYSFAEKRMLHLQYE